MTGRGTDIVRSVTLLYTRTIEAPLRLNADPLGQPRRTDFPTPHSSFVEDCLERRAYGTTTAESTVAELFVFKNTKSAKKLNVSVWPIEHKDEDGMFDLHYAFLLQVIDV